MADYSYQRANIYTDLEEIYKNCSGPGGLKLAEFIADKIEISQGSKLLDVGTNNGYQTCFLAKIYGPFIIGIDPWGDSVEQLMKNAKKWGVEHKVIGLKAGVPDTGFATDTFDRVYSTTTLEMIRGMKGKEGYKECVKEIYRIIRPSGIFGLGEPMHKDVEIPEEIYPYVTKGEMPAPWTDCFATLQETVEAVESAGFTIIESGEAPDAQLWWEEYGRYDPEAGDDYEVLMKDKGRWTTFGYVIARK